MSHDEKEPEPADPRDDRIGSALDRFIGTWSDAESGTFLKSIRLCEQIDPAL